MLTHGKVLAGGLALFFALPVSAARPFVTEDAAVLEARECELESFFLSETARGAPRTEAGLLQAACGVGSSTQLGIGLAREKVGADESSFALLGGKTSIREQQGDRAGLTIAYRFAASKVPQGSFRRESIEVAAVASIPWQGAVLHANLGWWSRLDPSRSDSTLWAIAYERPWAHGVDVGAEVYGTDRSAAWFGLAARWALIENLSVDASYAIQSDPARAKRLTLGAKFAF